MSVDGTDSCNGSRIDISEDFTDWWSGNTSVVTLANQQVHAVGVGATKLYAEGSVYEGQGTNCTWVDAIPLDPTIVFNAQVSSVNLPSDSVQVSLTGPSGTSGELIVTWNGPGPNPNIADVTEGPGTYTFNPSLGGLQPGQYSGVTAKWMIDGITATATSTYNFNVLGTWRHSQYNTPTESKCSGSPSSAYEVNVTTCAYQTNPLNATFIQQAWLNGSGDAVSLYFGYNTEQNAQYCINKGYLPGDATGKSFAFEPKIVPYCGASYSLGIDTVAWNFTNTQTLNCGDQVLLVGYGNSPGTVKTITDRCAPNPPNSNGCSNTQLDNYTTSPGCNPRSFTDLGNFVTIRLGR